MSMEDYINDFKRDFGYGRCQEVPDEMIKMILNGNEDDDLEDLLFEAAEH